MYGAKVCLCAFLLNPALEAYAVLSHEAIIDSAWEHDIHAAAARTISTGHAGRACQGPRLCRRPHSGHRLLPFGSHLFTDLVHYVRSGEFVMNLVKEAQDLDEYAFALGALAHYVADNQGYANGINPSVAIEYPKLERKFGKAPTYATIPSRTSGWNSASTCFRWRAATTRRSLITISTASRSQSRFSSASATLIPSRLSISSAIWISLWGLTAAPLSTVTPEMTRSAGKAKKAELMKVQPA